MAKRAKCRVRGLARCRQFEFGGAREPLDEGLGDRQTQQSLGILDGKGIGDAGADVVADDMGAIDLEMIHQRPDVARQRLLVIARGRALGPAGAAQIRHDQPIAFAERGHHLRERIAGLGKPVQQQQRLAARADVAVVDRCAVHRYHAGLDGKSGGLGGGFHRNLLGAGLTCRHAPPNCQQHEEGHSGARDIPVSSISTQCGRHQHSSLARATSAPPGGTRLASPRRDRCGRSCRPRWCEGRATSA